uniref:Uncharacterized protein n=1 Tax=Salix viminalis TaxID=40686 RepID=A0A6N2MC88_SALVM
MFHTKVRGLPVGFPKLQLSEVLPRTLHCAHVRWTPAAASAVVLEFPGSDLSPASTDKEDSVSDTVSGFYKKLATNWPRQTFQVLLFRATQKL